MLLTIKVIIARLWEKKLDTQEEFLYQTNDFIKKTLSQKCPNDFLQAAYAKLQSVSDYSVLSDSAKRIRPFLCFAYQSLFINHNEQKIINIAAAAELIHCASLLHDDVIDNSDKRRGKLSANNLYGNNVAILSGNYLLAIAFEILISIDKKIMDNAIYTVKEMSLGCMMEIESRGKLDSSKEYWRQIALKKTSSLFSWCGFCVGFLLGATKDIENLCKLSNHIGLAFQMSDDIKDLNTTTKSYCNDLKNKDLSLPIVLSIKKNLNSYETFKEIFSKEEISLNDIEVLKNVMIKNNIIQDITQMLKAEVVLIQDILTNYKNSLGEKYINSFIENFNNQLIS